MSKDSPSVRMPRWSRLTAALPAMVFGAIAAAFLWGLFNNDDGLPSTMIGRDIPEFDLPPIEGRGKGLTTADLRGEVSLVNVWASWCVPCRVAARAYLRRKAPLALAVLAAVVGGAAFNLAPILPLAIIGAAVVLVAGCVGTDEGLGSIDGRLLLLIVSMLVLGTSLEKTGAMQMVVDGLAARLAVMSPLLTLAIIYTITSILTEVVTNNAVAVIMTPIAAGVAAQLGLDPRAFIVAVMFGASASFATPIGYQTNTMVYSAGGYRFADFLKIGLPMNIIAGLVTVLLAPIIWPLNH